MFNMTSKKKNRNYLIYFSSFLLMGLGSFIWSYLLLVEWGTDFGVYYVGAKYWSDSFSLYGLMTDHKGPVYYAFLKFLGNIYGWGAEQAVISLFLTCLVFNSAVSWVAFKYKLSKLEYFSVALLTSASFHLQPSNSSISWFQAGIMLLSLYYLVYSIKIIKVQHFYISFLFLLIAVLVRIDALIFGILHLGAFIWHFNRINRKTDIFFSILVCIVMVLVAVFLPPWLFQYKLIDYYNQNIFFNFTGRSDNFSLRGILFRPTAAELLMKSGLLLFVISLILFKLLIIFKKKWYKLKTIDNGEWLTFAILVYSLLFWGISGSDKNYHVIILYPGIFLFILSNITKYLKRVFLYVLSSYLLYVFFLMTIRTLSWTGIYPQNTNNILEGKFFNAYSHGSSLMQYRRAIVLFKDHKSAYVIGGLSWFYLFSNTRPLMSLADFWFYTRNAKELETEEIRLSHQNLLKSVGMQYLVHRSIFDKPSKYAKELLKKSKMICYTDGSRWLALWEITERTDTYTTRINVQKARYKNWCQSFHIKNTRENSHYLTNQGITKKIK
jgi:hypothetical protein